MRYLCFFLWMLASPLMAQTAQVTSGEHEGFTRLVLRLAPEAEWSLTPDASGFRLTLDPTWVYDLTTAFDRIPRTRVAALTALGDGQLQLDLACHCAADPFFWNDRYLVIDIKEVERTRPALLPVVLNEPEPELVVPWPATEAQDTIVSNIEAELANSLAQAAGLGVLDPVLDPVPLPEISSDILAGDSPIGLATHNELALALLGQSREVELDKQHCLPATFFALDSWAAAAGDDRGQYRALVGEFDRVDQITVRDLVRSYLIHGLAVEAAAALQLLEDGQEKEAFVALTATLDGEIKGQSFLRGQQNCENGASVWAVASGAGDLPIDFDRFEREFRLLPLPVRDLLFRPVAEQLFDWLEAERVEALSGRVSRDHPDLEWAKGQIALSRGEPIQAYRNMLNNIRSGSLSLVSAQNLMATAVQYDLAVPPDVFDTVQTIGFLWRGDPDTERLALDLAEVHARNGEFREAFTLLARSKEVPIIANSRVTELLVSNATDAEFLRLALTALPDQLTNDARGAVAARLNSMGFEQQALQFDRGFQDEPTVDVPTNDIAALDLTDGVTLALTSDLLRSSAESRDRIALLLSSGGAEN